MPETVLPGKKHQRIFILKDGPRWDRGLGFDAFIILDVLAWGIDGHKQPVPITPLGRIDPSQEYILSSGNGCHGWMAIPTGQIFESPRDVEAYLEKQRGE